MSNHRLKYLLLLILPVLLFISARLLKVAQGPYYLNFEDPSYVYLVNSLNVSLRFPVGHFDHPGTSVQVIGAVVIRLFHKITNNDSDLMIDVLSRPEEYLNNINLVLIIISSIVLFFLGLLTYKFSRNILLSLLIQLSPFVSLEIFYGYKIVASDNFLISAVLCFIGILIYYLFKIDDKGKTPLKFILIFSVICGLGLATKISFFPLMIIPLILINGIKNKIIFVLTVLFSFLIFVLPAISNYKEFFDWLFRLFLHSGSYGHGDDSVIDYNSFNSSLKSIFELDPFFGVSYFFSIAVIVFVKLKSGKDIQFTGRQRKEMKLLFSLILATTIQIIIVAKQYRQHYMIPAFLLSMLSLSLCISLLSSCISKLSVRAANSIIIAIVAIISFYRISDSYQTCLMLNEEATKVNRYVKEHSSNALVIPSFGSASKEFSLAFGVSYAGQKMKLYKSVLSEIQKEKIFYLPWFDYFFSITSDENVKKILRENRKMLFQTNQNNADKFVKTLENTYHLKIISIKKVFSNSIDEKVFEVTTGGINDEKLSP